MAWTYSDWNQQSGDAAKLARLILHEHEVADKISAEVSGGGMFKSTNNIRLHLDYLREERRVLEARVGGGPTAPGISYVRVGGS